MATTLSACMIVRDEIDCLEDCLDSLAPWVDEIAILDTGSVDGTWELVQVRAHQKAQIVWPDHFAQARNQALELATGDWVLVVDADERLVSGGDALRAAIGAADLLAGEICLRNNMGNGTHAEFWAVRLFRRLPQLRYSGRIHEQIAGSVREMMAADPRWRTERIPLFLEHDGYIPERFEAKGKAERNIRLLDIAVSELGTDASLHQRVYLEYKLSAALGAGPQGQMWLLRSARRLLDASEEELGTVPLAAEILVGGSQAWCRSGEGAEALVAAERAATRAPGHPMVLLVRAQALLLLGDLEEARAALELAGRPGANGFFFDRDGHSAALSVAQAELAHRSGDHDDAVRILTEAAAALPDHRALGLARLHALVRAGQAQQALREGVAHLKTNPGDRGGLLVCAAAAEALGMIERAQRWRAMAMG
jgi:hypothetical protein